MSGPLFANNAVTSLAADLTVGATSLTVANSVLFPAPGVGEWFWATISDASDTVWEDVKVTAVTGTTWTVTRGTDGNTALAWSAGAIISCRPTASAMRDILANASGGGASTSTQYADTPQVGAVLGIQGSSAGWGGYSNVCVIPGWHLLREGTGWKAEITVKAAPLLVQKAVLRRTLAGSSTWTDTTILTKDGSTSFTLPVGSTFLDACLQSLDRAHDAYLILYVDPAANSSASMDLYVRGTAAGFGGYASGDFTASASTAGLSTGNSGWYGLSRILIGDLQALSTVQEYAYNYSTTTASDSTSFASGPTGALVQAFAPANNGTTVNKRVRFQTPILSTDSLVIEWQFAPGDPWIEVPSSRIAKGGYHSYWAGVALAPVSGSNTDVEVCFFTYSEGNGNTWAYYGASRWRVRKRGTQAVINPPYDVHSYTETLTDKTWVDGKPIYRKVVNFGSLPNATTKNVAHGISGTFTLVNMTPIGRSASSQYVIPDAAHMIWVTATDIVFSATGNQSAETAVVTLEYTKG